MRIPQLTMFASLTETFMAPAGSKEAAAAGKAASKAAAKTAGKATGKTPGSRPSPLRPTRAASAADANPSKTAASSRQPSGAADGAPSDRPAATDEPIQTKKDKDEPSVFDTFGDAAGADDAPEPPRASIDMDELPIELISFADRYVCAGVLLSFRTTC